MGSEFLIPQHDGDQGKKKKIPVNPDDVADVLVEVNAGAMGNRKERRGKAMGALSVVKVTLTNCDTISSMPIQADTALRLARNLGYEH